METWVSTCSETVQIGGHDGLISVHLETQGAKGQHKVPTDALGLHVVRRYKCASSVMKCASPMTRGMRQGRFFCDVGSVGLLIMQYGGERLTIPMTLVGDTERVFRAACDWIQVHDKKQSG